MSEQSIESTGALSAAVAVEEASAVAKPARVQRKKVSPFTWLIYVYLVIMSIFALFPIYYVVQASLAGAQNLYTTELRLLPLQPSLSNYLTMLSNGPQQTLLSWIANTFLIALASTFFGLAFATFAGYALSRFRFRLRQGTLVGLLALQAFPSLLALLAYYLLLQNLHLINTLPGLILIYSSGTLVFGTWNMKGYFDSIPAELEQAAWVDGATTTQAFFRVALPLAAPALAATALLMFLGPWNEFAIANQVLNANDTWSNLTFALGLNSLQSDYRVPWGLFSAASVIVSVPLMAVFLYAQRFFQSGLTVGSVKG
jgi:arabinogalactan oligomer / maltooligosaccharide transport system permease protein